MSDSPEIPAARLRAALAAQDFQKASELLPTYCKAVEQKLKRLSAADPEARGLYTETQEFFGWMRSTALSLRAQIRQQLETLDSLSPYFATTTARRTWNLQA